MSELETKRCLPCEGGVPPLQKSEIERLLGQVPGWRVAPDQKSIFREFSFANYYQTMAFVNAVAWIAHREDHHPDLEVAYKSCVVRYSTHAVGGLSENDFICAAKVEKLQGSR